MKKISIMQAFSNEILKEQKLTIGMDLGDRWSFYCVLDEADLSEHTAKSDRPGDRHTFPVDKPAAHGAGTRSARGARTEGGIDHQEQSKR